MCRFACSLIVKLIAGTISQLQGRRINWMKAGFLESALTKLLSLGPEYRMALIGCPI